METIFSTPTDTFFIFENGGNDAGTIQPINLNDTLGSELAFNSSTYTDTPYDSGIGSQDVKGLVVTTATLVKGIRITSSGFDALSISAVYYEEATPTPTPTPTRTATFISGSPTDPSPRASIS